MPPQFHDMSRFNGANGTVSDGSFFRRQRTSQFNDVLDVYSVGGIIIGAFPLSGRITSRLTTHQFSMVLAAPIA